MKLLHIQTVISLIYSLQQIKLWGYLLGTILAGVAGIAFYRYKDFS